MERKKVILFSLNGRRNKHKIFYASCKNKNKNDYSQHRVLTFNFLQLIRNFI
jgi:hypothetical protein